MEADDAWEPSLIVVVLPDAAVHDGADSDAEVDDGCAGGIVRFSLGSDGH